MPLESRCFSNHTEIVATRREAGRVASNRTGGNAESGNARALEELFVGMYVRVFPGGSGAGRRRREPLFAVIDFAHV